MKSCKEKFLSYPESVKESAWDVVSQDHDLNPNEFSFEAADLFDLWAELLEYALYAND